MKKKTIMTTLSILLGCTFWGYESCAMQNMDQNQKEEYKKILDELIPIPEFKKTDYVCENFNQLNITSSKKGMGRFEHLPKGPWFNIFSHFSLDDLQTIKRISGFFVLAENRSRILLRDIWDAVPKVYITPEDLLKVYRLEDLNYICGKAKNKCKDFLLENGHLKED